MSFEYAWYIQLQGWIDFFFFMVGFCTPSPGWNGGLCSRRSSHPYLLHCRWTALIPRDRCWLPSGAMSRGDPYFTICSDKRGRHGGQRCGKDQGTTVRVNAKVGCGGNRSPWLFKEAHGRKRGVWARHRKARKRREGSALPACLESRIFREVKTEESRTRRTLTFVFQKEFWNTTGQSRMPSRHAYFHGCLQCQCCRGWQRGCSSEPVPVSETLAVGRAATTSPRMSQRPLAGVSDWLEALCGLRLLAQWVFGYNCGRRSLAKGRRNLHV